MEKGGKKQEFNETLIDVRRSIYLRQAMFIQTFFSIQTWRNETMVIQTSKKYL